MVSEPRIVSEVAGMPGFEAYAGNPATMSEISLVYSETGE
jgi:hypothetical protein